MTRAGLTVSLRPPRMPSCGLLYQVQAFRTVGDLKCGGMPCQGGVLLLGTNHDTSGANSALARLTRTMTDLCNANKWIRFCCAHMRSLRIIFFIQKRWMKHWNDILQSLLVGNVAVLKRQGITFFLRQIKLLEIRSTEMDQIQKTAGFSKASFRNPFLKLWSTHGA